METYCVCCKKNANVSSSFRKTKQNRLILLANCVVCGKKKSSLIKNKRLHNFNKISNDSFKINKIISFY